MRVLLFILIFVPAALAQSFQFVPANPKEIVKFKQQFSFPNAESILLFKLTGEDDKLIALGPKTFQTWDAAKGTLISSVSHEAGADKNFKYSNLISSDGSKMIVSDSWRWGLRKEKNPVSANVYDLVTGKFISKLAGDTESIRGAMWSENGKTLVTLSDFLRTKDTEVCFWDGETLAKRGCMRQPGELQWRVLSRDGKRFYTGVEISAKWFPSTKSLVIWDAEKGAVSFITKLDDIGFLSTGLTLSPSEKLLAQYRFNSVEIGEIGKTYQRSFETHLAKGSTVILFGSFSPDEKLAAIKNGKNGTEFYDTRTGELKRTLPTVDMSPDLWADDGKVLISYYCGKAKAWSFETGALLYQIKLVCKDHFEIVETVTDDEDSVKLHPNGDYLFTYSGTAVRIWDAAGGELLQTVVAPGREAEKARNPKSDDMIRGRTALWSRDGKYLYILSNDEKSVLQYEFVG